MDLNKHHKRNIKEVPFGEIACPECFREDLGELKTTGYPIRLINPLNYAYSGFVEPGLSSFSREEIFKQTVPELRYPIGKGVGIVLKAIF